MRIGLVRLKSAKELEVMFKHGGDHLWCKNWGEEHGDWRIEGKDAKLYFYEISHLLTPDQIRIVNHEEIAFGQLRRHRQGERYDKCDISFPGIICDGAPNPFGKRYRMIDGRHRMAKMINMKVTKSCYYVIEYAILKPFFIFHRTS